MIRTMFQSLTCTNIFVSSAEISGFVEVKKSATTGSDYVFVVEVVWSDGRTVCIKRSYKDFLNFRKLLATCFQNEKNNSLNPVCIPQLEGLKLFRWYNRQLAEERETELHAFVTSLFKEESLISSHSIVVDFFEPRPTDPVPYRSSPDGDSFGDDEDDPFSEEVFSRKWIKKKISQCTI